VPARSGPLAVGGVALVALLVATTFPYGRYAADRPLCSGAVPVVDPAECSTDLIARGRFLREVTLPDGSRFWSRVGESWRRVSGTGPDPEGLGNILTAAGVPGLAEQTLPDVFGAAPATPADRLTPHISGDRPNASVELTLDPRLQLVAGEALTARSADPATPALAGGIVVLDARSGHVLAAASAPGTVAVPAQPVDLTDEQRSAFDDRYGEYGRRQGDGGIVADPTCVVRPAIRENRDDCLRWFLRDEKFVDRTLLQAQENERYVADGSSAPVAEEVSRPDDTANRALDRLYQFGSTFKVVIAAAWLQDDTTRTAHDTIPSPATYELAGQPVGNPGGGVCAGTVGGRITLQMALAVSCNTAFVALADSLGWAKIKSVAETLGFVPQLHVDPEKAPRDALARSPFARRSIVPEYTSGLGMRNVALGGNELQGTPLQMASVMATIANGGRYVQPTVAGKVRAPGADEAVPVQSPPVENALAPEVAAQMREALAKTADPECDNCTAHLLERPAGVTVHAKTGTHVRGGDVDSYVHEFAWITGFVDRPSTGPVAFAIVLEAPERRGAGGARAREVVTKVLDAVVEERG
jgi:cell division protein FtsI/penicillin-binding protein 2